MREQWDQIAASDEFAQLEPAQRQVLAERYFDRAVAPEAPVEHLEAVRTQFLSRVAPQVSGASMLGGGGAAVARAGRSIPSGDDEDIGRIETALSQFARGAGGVAGSFLRSMALWGKPDATIFDDFDVIDAGGSSDQFKPSGTNTPMSPMPKSLIDRYTMVQEYEALPEEERGAMRQRILRTLREAEDSPTYRAGNAMDAWFRRTFETNPDYREEFFNGKVPQGFGSMVGFMLPVIATRGQAVRAGVPAGAVDLGLPAALGSQVNAADQFADALDHNASIEDAYRASYIGEAVGLTEGIPIARFFDRWDTATGGSVSQTLKRMARQGVEEGLQESFTTLMANFTASDLVGYDPDRNLWTGSGEAAGVGFTTGALLEFLGSVVSGNRRSGGGAPLQQQDVADFIDRTGRQPTIQEITARQRDGAWPAESGFDENATSRTEREQMDALGRMQMATQQAEQLQARLTEDGHPAALAELSFDEMMSASAMTQPGAMTEEGLTHVPADAFQPDVAQALMEEGALEEVDLGNGPELGLPFTRVRDELQRRAVMEVAEDAQVNLDSLEGRSAPDLSGVMARAQRPTPVAEAPIYDLSGVTQPRRPSMRGIATDPNVDLAAVPDLAGLGIQDAMRKVREQTEALKVLDLAGVDYSRRVQEETAERIRKGLFEWWSAPIAAKLDPNVIELDEQPGRGAPEALTSPVVRQNLSALSEQVKGASAPTVQGPVNPARDPLLLAVAKLGGISRAEAGRQGIDPADFQRGRFGNRSAFPAKGGRTLDGMREVLAEQGYLTAESTENDALDLIQRALRGERVVSTSFDAGNVPEWLDRMGLSGEQAATLIEKGLTGRALGPRQAENLSAIIEEMEAEANGGRPVPDVDPREAVIRGERTDYQSEYDEGDYSPGASDAQKALTDQMVAALDAGVPVEQLEAIVEQHESDAAAAYDAITEAIGVTTGEPNDEVVPAEAYDEPAAEPESGPEAGARGRQANPQPQADPADEVASEAEPAPDLPLASDSVSDAYVPRETAQEAAPEPPARTEPPLPDWAPEGEGARLGPVPGEVRYDALGGFRVGDSVQKKRRTSKRASATVKYVFALEPKAEGDAPRLRAELLWFDPDRAADTDDPAEGGRYEQGLDLDEIELAPDQETLVEPSPAEVPGTRPAVSDGAARDADGVPEGLLDITAQAQIPAGAWLMGDGRILASAPDGVAEPGDRFDVTEAYGYDGDLHGFRNEFGGLQFEVDGAVPVVRVRLQLSQKVTPEQFRVINSKVEQFADGGQIELHVDQTLDTDEPARFERVAIEAIPRSYTPELEAALARVVQDAVDTQQSQFEAGTVASEDMRAFRHSASAETYTAMEDRLAAGEDVEAVVSDMMETGRLTVEPIQPIEPDTPPTEYDPETSPLPAPAETVNLASTMKKGPFVTRRDADRALRAMKREAKRIGAAQGNELRERVIVSLFDHSGVWSQPYRDMGYTVLQYDIKHGHDLLRAFPVDDFHRILEEGRDVAGVIAQPPCTTMAGSGARWRKPRHDASSSYWVEKMWGPEAAELYTSPLEYNQYLVAQTLHAIRTLGPDFAVLENPIGRIQEMTPLPDPLMRIEPSNFGHPYTKKTNLWGFFNTNLQTMNVEATEGSRMHKLRGRDEKDEGLRSLTPEGFAYAFALANAPGANVSIGDSTVAPPAAPEGDGGATQEAELDGDANARSLGERGGRFFKVATAYFRMQQRGPITVEEAARLREHFAGADGLAALESIAEAHGDKSIDFISKQVLAASGIGPDGGQVGGEQQGDLVGGVDENAQALADEQRRRDRARSPGTDVSAGQGGDLFSGQQADIADAVPEEARTSDGSLEISIPAETLAKWDETFSLGPEPGRGVYGPANELDGRMYVLMSSGGRPGSGQSAWVVVPKGQYEGETERYAARYRRTRSTDDFSSATYWNGSVITAGKKQYVIVDKAWLNPEGAEAATAVDEAAAGGEVDRRTQELIDESNRIAAEKQARMERIRSALSPAEAVELEDDRGRRRLLSRDASKPGSYRITRFDGDEPVGHMEFASLDAAIEEAARERMEPVAAPEAAPEPAPEAAPADPETGPFTKLDHGLDDATARGLVDRLNRTRNEQSSGDAAESMGYSAALDELILGDRESFEVWGVPEDADAYIFGRDRARRDIEQELAAGVAPRESSSSSSDRAYRVRRMDGESLPASSDMKVDALRRALKPVRALSWFKRRPQTGDPKLSRRAELELAYERVRAAWSAANSLNLDGIALDSLTDAEIAAIKQAYGDMKRALEAALPSRKVTTPREIESQISRMREFIEAATPQAEDSETSSENSGDGERAIEDFGEKIAGARKDIWVETARTLEAVPGDEIAQSTFTKVWPEPNYQKLLDGGADPMIVAFVRAARDEVPAKPRKGYKLRDWAKKVGMLRDMSRNLLSGEVELEMFTDELARRKSSLGPVIGRMELYQEIGHERSLKGVTLLEHHFSLYRGRENVNIWQVLKSAKATAFSNMPREIAAGDTREEAIELFRSRLSVLDEQPKKERSRHARFKLYRKPDQRGTFIGVKIGGNYVDLEHFDTTQKARDYFASNEDALIEKLEQFKKIPDHRRQNNAPRVGADHRMGADVTPEMFQDAFGFRGVQFGNYVEDGRRQADLNRAYDGLMDLAGVLDVPSQALSLNGELGLAFGARGKGGKNAALAHYEPDHIVINLTKTGGPGSLAHEWWHALDNYFMRTAGNGSDYLSRLDRADLPNTRPAVVEAMNNVRAALAETALKARSQELDKRRTKDYWATDIEMSARAFESYVIAKLGDEGFANDYLVNIVADPAMFAVDNGFPYVLESEIEGVKMAYDAFFNVLETKRTDAGLALFARGSKMSEALQTPPADARGEPNAMSVEDVQRVIAPTVLEWNNGPMVRVVKRWQDLPPPLAELVQAEQAYDLRGLLAREPEPVVFLVSDNLLNAEDALRTLAHEAVGHFAIERMLGEEVDKLFERAHWLASTDEVVAGYAERIRRHYGPMSPRLEGHEIVAHMAEDGVEHGIIRQIMVAIRQALRRLGFRVPFNRTELEHMLSRAARSLRSSNMDYPTPGDGSMARGMRGLPTEARFYSTFAQHVDIRADGGASAAETREAVMREGFQPGFGMNAISPLRGGAPRSVVERRFQPSVGDVAYFAPPGAWENRPSGMRIREGWRPEPWQAVVIREEDVGRPAYEIVRDAYARAQDADASFARGPSAAAQGPLDEKFGRREDPSVREQLAEASTRVKERLRQGVIDQFESFRSILDDRRTWMMASMSRTAPQALDTLIHMNGLRLVDNAIDVDRTVKSLSETMEPLGDEIDQFLQWVAGNRAERLKQEGRENLFSAQDIRTLKARGTGRMADGRDRASVYQSVLTDFEAINQSVTKLAVDTGLVDPAEAQLWAQQGYYVPFYRIAEGDDRKAGAPGFNGRLTNQTAYKRLKGGDLPLDDLLTNVLSNWSHLIQASLNNQTALRALEIAATKGLAVEVAANDKDKGAVYVRDGGKQRWFELDESVDGQLVLESLSALNWEGFQDPLMKAARWAKRLHTTAVTVNPEFRIANLIRDSLHSIAVVPMSKNIPRNVVEGWQATDRNNPVYATMLASGAVFDASGYIYGGDPEAIKRLVRSGVNRNRILADPRRIWDWWQDTGGRAENINRAAAFLEAQRRGADLLESSFEARDLLDFSRMGAWNMVRRFTQSVSFLNARLQGIDKLGRAYMDPAQRAQFLQVTLTYSALATLLHLYMLDDDEYREAEEWKHDAYHMLKTPWTGDVMLFIPRPFEVGAISNIIERSAQIMSDDEFGGQEFRQRLTATLTNSLSLNPLEVRLFWPMVEVWANWNSFRGAQIENIGMQRLPKMLRARPWTSPTAQLVSEGLNTTVGEELALSPLQVEHLIYGYTAWAGTMMLAGVDQAVAPLVGAPTAPAKQWWDYPVIRRFARENDNRTTKYVETFYETAQEIDRVNAAVREYRSRGQREQADAVRDENRDLMRYRRLFSSTQRAVGTMNRQIREVWRDESLTPQEKRERIETLTQRRNDRIERVVRRYRAGQDVD